MSAHPLLPRFNAWTLPYILLIPGIITLGANHDHTDSQGYSIMREGPKGGKEKRFWDYSSFIPSSMSFLLTVGFLKVGNQPITGNAKKGRTPVI